MTAAREELARTIRLARSRVTPQDLGLPIGPHRRVQGLRREELAMIAGISVDYIARLEQARGPRPSEQVLDALARALQLGTDERALLFRQAGAEPPRPGSIDMLVQPSVLRMIERFADMPAIVVSAKGDILAWNAMASALHGDWSAIPARRRNFLRMRFLPHADDLARTQLVGSAECMEANDAMLVGTARQASGQFPKDPGLTRLLDDLRAGSMEFRDLWVQGPARTWRTQTNILIHPQIGRIVLERDILQVPDAHQQLHVYSAAPGTPAADALALLRVIGTQQLSANT